MSFNATHGLQDKTDDGFSSNSILLLKVNYPSTSKYGENQVNFTSIDQDGISNSILDCNEASLSDQNIEICDKETPSYPMLLLHSDIAQQEIVETSVDPRSVFSNFLFASLPKSDLCTVSAKDFDDVADAPESTVTVSSVDHLIEAEDDHTKQDEIIHEINTIENEYLERQIYQVEGNSSSEDDGDEVCKVIYDKPVVCRARGTLPRQYLYLDYSSKNKTIRGNLGVFANKILPKKTLFGPMEGILVDSEEMASEDFQLLVIMDEAVKKLDVSNENLSNWMRYVRAATCREDQNVSVYQHGRNLYYRTIRRIAPNEELRVWYDPDYAKLRNLRSFIPPTKKQKPLLLVRPVEINREENREWKCSRCNCTFTSATLLNLHVLTHAADNIETEGLESMTSDCIDQNELIQLQINENDYICKHCSTPFSSDADLKNHLSTHEYQTHAEKQYFACQTCSKSFSTNSGLKNHLKKNICNPGKSEESSAEQESPQIKTEKKSFICKECSESFTSNTALTRHMKTHGPQKIFECPICKNVFLSLLLLKDHIHRHAVDGIYKCPHCSKEFKRYKPIRNHIRSYHSKKQCVCHICNKAFSSNDKLKLHHLRHSDHRNFSCSVCGQKFKRKDKVVAHLRRFHINPVKKAKPKKRVIRCSLDSSTYNEMVYKCHICFVGFKRRGMLVNHQAKMHPDVPQESFPELNLPILKDDVLYFCQYCDKKYKSSTKRKFHVLKVHPGESLPPSYSKAAATGKSKFSSMYCKTVGSVMTRPHSCQWCFKQYATNGKLLDHQRKCHLELLPKELQVPLRSKKTSQAEEDIQYKDTMEPLLSNPLDSNISDFEMALGDTRVSEGEFIIDAATLRKAVKEDVLSAELSSENLAELNQLIESRPDQYFKVYQTSSGLTFARPVEVWDPISTCQTLSPSTNDNDFFEPV